MTTLKEQIKESLQHSNTGQMYESSIDADLLEDFEEDFRNIMIGLYNRIDTQALEELFSGNIDLDAFVKQTHAGSDIVVTDESSMIFADFCDIAVKKVVVVNEGDIRPMDVYTGGKEARKRANVRTPGFILSPKDCDDLIVVGLDKNALMKHPEFQRILDIFDRIFKNNTITNTGYIFYKF